VILKYICHYIVLVMVGWSFGIVFGEMCAWTERKLRKSRLGESISSKQELQNLVSDFGSCCSLRRPGWVLSYWHSRLGENGSPKRGRDENLYHFERDFSSRQEDWVLSNGHSRLGESGSPKRVHDIEMMNFSLNPRSGEVCVLFWAKVWLAQAR